MHFGFPPSFYKRIKEQNEKKQTNLAREKCKNNRACFMNIPDFVGGGV